MKDAPVYGDVPNSEIADFYDKIISCSSDVPEDHKQYIQYQTHRHSRSCRVGKARSCRFGFPKPPMDKTYVLEPFTCEEQDVLEPFTCEEQEDRERKRTVVECKETFEQLWFRN